MGARKKTGSVQLTSTSAGEGGQLAREDAQYLDFVRFILPLALTTLVYSVGGPILNGGMARLPQATQTLAAFTLAWGIVDFLSSPLSQVRQLGLVLVDGRQAQGRVLGFVLLCSAGLALCLGLLAYTPVGDWVVDRGHRVTGALAGQVRLALAWLVAMPLLEGMTRLQAGLLMRRRRTVVLTYATGARMGTSIALVFLLLPLVREQPLALPLAVTYGGVCVELAVLVWGGLRYAAEYPPSDPARPELSFGSIARFFWPLALVMAVQGLSRPLINFFVARRVDGVEALAVLAVVYPLAHMPYGWLNELRSLPAAFPAASRRRILRFCLGCGSVSFAVMLTLFWTPLRDVLLTDYIGIEPALSELGRWPLMLFSFFPLCVMARAYLHGLALVERRTAVLAPSGPARIAIIAVVMAALPASLFHGATLGIAALLSGFALELLVVWAGLRRT